MKRNREILEKAFPKAYIAHGLNATKAYKALKTTATYKTANVEGTKTLAKPSVRKEIEELLAENELTVELAMKTHKRNLTQNEELGVSQRAVQDVYKLAGVKGFTQDSNNTTTNTMIFIKE